MNKELLKEMEDVVEEFTEEFLKEVHEEFGYTNDDVRIMWAEHMTQYVKVQN